MTSQIKSHVRTIIPYKTMQTENSGEGFEFSLRRQEDQTCVACVVGYAQTTCLNQLNLVSHFPFYCVLVLLMFLSDWKQSFEMAK